MINLFLYKTLGKKNMDHYQLNFWPMVEWKKSFPLFKTIFSIVLRVLHKINCFQNKFASEVEIHFCSITNKNISQGILLQTLKSYRSCNSKLSLLQMSKRYNNFLDLPLIIEVLKEIFSKIIVSTFFSHWRKSLHMARKKSNKSFKLWKTNWLQLQS